MFCSRSQHLTCGGGGGDGNGGGGDVQFELTTSSGDCVFEIYAADRHENVEACQGYDHFDSFAANTGTHVIFLTDDEPGFTIRIAATTPECSFTLTRVTL